MANPDEKTHASAAFMELYKLIYPILINLL